MCTLKINKKTTTVVGYMNAIEPKKMIIRILISCVH